LAFSRRVAMLELMLLLMQGSAAERYMYGLAGVVYGQGAPTAPTLLLLLSEEPMDPGSIEALFMLTATPLAPVLKQFTEFWWWLPATIDPSGFTGHGKGLVPSGEGTLVQLLYGYELYSESSANGCMNCVPNPDLKSAAATAAFIALRSRLRHLARRFLNHTWGGKKGVLIRFVEMIIYYIILYKTRHPSALNKYINYQ